MKKVIDWQRVRASLTRLDRLAEEHPEAFNPDRLNGPEGLVETLEREERDSMAKMGRPRTNPEGLQLFTLRLAPSDIERIERLAARIPGASTRPLARDLLLKALAEAEKEAGQKRDPLKVIGGLASEPEQSEG